MSKAKAKTCFIIMPISTPEAALELYDGDSDHFIHVLDCLFSPAIENSGLQPIGPIVAGSDLIHAKTIKNLSSADLVLCDMSQLNANVFFEFGIRTALNKPVALITDEVTKNIPFDTGIINYHRYNSTLQGWLIKDEIKKLSEHIDKTIESDPDRNSLWRYFGIAQTGTLSTEQATPDDKLTLLIRKIDSLTEAAKLPPHLISHQTFDTLPSYRDALDEFKKSYFSALMTGGLSIREMAELSGLAFAQFYEMLKKYQRQIVAVEDDSGEPT